MKTHTHTQELIDEAIEDAAYWKGQAKNVPELLAALKRLIGEHADLGEVDLTVDECAAIEQAREAISKAEGVK
jgi:hypothetical protein